MTTIDPKAGLLASQSLQLQQQADAAAGAVTDAQDQRDPERLGRAARQFESYFISMMLKEMRKTVPKEGGLFEGQEMDTWMGMFDQEIATRISEGKGLGLAASLLESMENQGVGGTETLGLTAYARAATPPTAAVPAPVSSVLREGWSWPLPAGEPGRLSSGFGHRLDPLHGDKRHHAGLDLAAPRGTPVLAMASGTVVYAGSKGAYGNFVEVDHGDGVRSRYAHQHDVHVEVGDRVEQGDQLGTVGSTGRSTGNHLHLEVRVDGKKIDPANYLKNH